MAGDRTRLLACILVSLGAVACASKVEPPTQSQPAIEAQEQTVAPDPCAERSLDEAVHEARAALEAGIGEPAEQLGVALEQALACEVGARRWQLELDAIDLLARLDPPPEPPNLRPCRVTSDGRCAYAEPKKRAPEDPPPPYDQLARARLDAYARYEAAAAPGEALRSIRDRHIRLRLHHHDFDGALPLLQSYVVDYHDHADAVRAAILLVDTQAMGWREPDGHSNLGTSMLAWFDRLATLALWHDPAAAELHRRVAELRPGAMWRAAEGARDEGRNEWAALVEAGLPPRYEVAGFRRCAELFMAIHEAYPDHDRSSTLLWNAAECYEANYDVGRAYATREMLLARYPDSEHSQYALRYQAETDHSLARYDQAQDHYLEYALRYPKDEHSDDALLFAYQFGHALGRDTTEIVDEYVRRNARRDVERTGRFLWATRPDEPQRLLEFADEFLRSFRFKAGLTSREALQVSAALHWAQACRTQLADGLCVERRAAERASQCSIGDVPLPKVRARERKQADEARSLMRAAAKYWETYEGRTWGDPDWRDKLAAESAFLLLEPELEDYLLAGPDAPDARARAKQLDADYLEVAALGQVDVAIRAHARRGLIWELLASPDLRLRAGTCLAATAWAHGDRRRALAGYSQCLELAVAQLHFNDAARRCEAKLAGEAPRRVAPLVELFGEPGLLPSAIEPSGVQQ